VKGTLALGCNNVIFPLKETSHLSEQKMPHATNMNGKISAAKFCVYLLEYAESKPSIPRLYPLTNWVHINNPEFVTH
jgi:hypothetical protein